jgi:hypothetical protein
MEISLPRLEQVSGLLDDDNGWSEVAVHADLSDLPRVVTARRKEGPQ